MEFKTAAQITELAEQLREQKTEAATVEAALDQLLEVMPEADSASITWRTSRKPLQTIAATDARARAADEAQYEFGEGPCVESAQDQDWHRSGDVAHDPRWPRWGPVAAREHGIGSLLAIPLSLQQRPIGAINIYSRHTGAFDDRDTIDFVSLYATHIAMQIATSRHMDGLDTAVQARYTIGLAQGILMARYDLDVQAAFALLRRYSNTTQVKLGEVAAEIVRTKGLPDVGQQD